MELAKEYPVFDCDAHINDYLTPWQKYYSTDERALLQDSYWNFGDYTLVNGKPLIGSRPKKEWWLNPGMKTAKGTPRPSIIDYMGPGRNKAILRGMYHGDLTAEELGEIVCRGSIEPEPRLRDMDLMGIDQVLIIPISALVSLPWVEHSRAAAIVARAYNDWVHNDYCGEAPDRLFPAAIMAPQSAHMAAEEIRRVAGLGFRVGLIRPVDALGAYPNQPRFDPMWQTFEETGMVCGMHTVTGGQHQTTQFSPGQTVNRAVSSAQIQSPGQVLSFIHEAMTWITGVMLSGFLERYPALKMAIFESNATWLPVILESCDRLYHLYGTQRLPKVRGLPSETFHERCLIAFESDEEPVYRRARYYENIGIWSSDTYHHDGAGAWEAIERMEKRKVPQHIQAKLMGGNARRFYGLEARAKQFTTRAPTSIPQHPALRCVAQAAKA